MAVAAGLLVAALLAFVAWLLSGPFRRRDTGAAASDDSDERRALESAREAKYAEIRDNETDFATGKLSDEDFRALDGSLRAEALEILGRLDERDARSTPGGAESR